MRQRGIALGLCLVAAGSSAGVIRLALPAGGERILRPGLAGHALCEKSELPFVGRARLLMGGDGSFAVGGEVVVRQGRELCARRHDQPPPCPLLNGKGCEP